MNADGPVGGDAQYWVRRSDVLWRMLLETVVLLRPEGDAPPLTISGSGAVVWELLAEPITLEQLSGELASCYTVSPDVISRDLIPVLADLEDAALVQRTT